MEVVEGHYQLDIPFKSKLPNLPDNRSVAEKRLQSLAHRFRKDPELHAKYKGGIQELLDKGYAEKVLDEEIAATPGQTWYLPHHNVVNENKPEKLRIVFDCSVTFGGTSLNKEVLQGPDFTNNLVGVLLRFREEQVAVMGDIEGMFHQVRVSPKHRDALRFLWWKNGEIGGEVEIYRMCVHLFGGVWSPSCASFALRRVANDHRMDFPEETIQAVLKNFYADDCLKSVGTTEEAINIVHSLCKLLALVGFRLTNKWNKLDEIDTRRSMVKIVERLPQSLQGRWRKSVVKTLEATGRYPPIAKLTQFVSEAAREATDPVFGVSEIKPKDSRRDLRRSGRSSTGSSFGVQGHEDQQNLESRSNVNDTKFKNTETTPRVCRLCKGDHVLSVCSRFKAMSPGERLSFDCGKKLCFCCFDGRHVVRQCKAGVICGVEGCTAKHSKLLHQSFERSGKENPGEQQAMANPGSSSQQVESHTHACSSSKHGEIKLALPIVPVRVRAKGQTVYYYTHALLDSGSTKTFCSDALIEKLGVKGQQVNLALTSVNSRENANVEVVALEVVAAKSGMGKTSVIQLPKVYALPNLPTLESCIASASDAIKWPHLKDLRIPRVDKSGVSILMKDVPEALWPLELRKGEEGQPYATRTLSGWSLNGPLDSEHLIEESALSNLVRADESLNAQVEQFWKIETSEALANSLPQFSVDDKRAVDI